MTPWIRFSLYDEATSSASTYRRGTNSMADGWTEESGGQVQPEKATPAQAGESAIVQEIIDNLAFTKSYEDLQRRAETEESEFEGESMWTEEALTARSAHDDEATGMSIPAKTTISVHLLDQNIQQNLAEARQARLALTVKPKSGLANTKTGNYLKGLVRTIQVESGSLEIRLWALERALKVGRGGWLVAAEFADDGDFDIDLREHRILDYATVYWDAYSQMANRKDAEWCLVSDWMSERERIRRWKDKPLILPDDAFQTEDHDWFAADAQDPGNRRVRIGTYYKVLHTTYTLGFTPADGRGWVGTAPEGSPIPILPPAAAEAVTAKAPGTLSREVDVRSVIIYVTDGSQVLETHPWHGRTIPVIETIGKEYFLKGKRRFKGIIANAMDLCRAINVLISSATEIAGSMPRTPYIMYEGQDEDYEEMWDDAPVKNYTRLYVRAVEIGGKPAPLPQRQQTEVQIQGLLLLLRMMHEMYHAVTGSVAPQLRAVNPYDRSGKAIEALQRQGAAGTSNYLDNLATVAMLYEGEVLLDAIPHYYDKPGRVLNINGEGEGDDEVAIMIKVPFTRGKDGQPIPVPCPTCKGTGAIPTPLAVLDPSTWMAPPKTCPACDGSKQATRDTMPQVWQDKEVEYVDFSDGTYKCVAAVDRSYQVQQEEALAGMEMLAKSAPNLVPTYADLWVRAMGFSGANDIADRIKSRMPEGSEEMQDIPPALMGKFMQLKQQHQQAMQALEEAQKMIDSDAMKSAGQKEIAMIRDAMQAKLEQIRQQGKMLQVQATSASDERIELLRGQLVTMQQESEQRHERMLATMSDRNDILLQLLKERGAQEQERHAVELHDAAAAKAAERAELSAVGKDARSAVTAEIADGRAQTAAAREADRTATRDLQKPTE